MDRRPRRFVPGSEDLEGRALLSGTAASTPAQVAATQTQTQTPRTAPVVTASTPAGVPGTLEQKQQRIDRLPFYLNSISNGRFIPPATVARLQAELRTIIGQLRRPPRPVVEAFNVQLRSALPYQTLRVQDARALNNSFGRVLQAAGATPAATQRLKAAMNELAQNDANSPQPVRLAVNDYALVLQTALGVGQPIQKAPAPATPPRTR